MSKVMDAVSAIKNAEAAVMDIVHPLAISIADGKAMVQVKALRDLEQIPGQVAYRDVGGSVLPIWAQKDYCDVVFFCMTTREELARIAWVSSMYSHPAIARQHPAVWQIAPGDIVEHCNLPGVTLEVVAGPLEAVGGGNKYTVRMPDGKVVSVLQKNLIR